MPSKFARYWKGIDTAPEGFKHEQIPVVKEMVRSAFHRGIQIEGKRSGFADLLERIAKLEAQLDVAIAHNDGKDWWRMEQRAIVAERVIERVRDECLKHVKLTKSPVLVLDTIGWILENK